MGRAEARWKNRKCDAALRIQLEQAKGEIRRQHRRGTGQTSGAWFVEFPFEQMRTLFLGTYPELLRKLSGVKTIRDELFRPSA